MKIKVLSINHFKNTFEAEIIFGSSLELKDNMLMYDFDQIKNAVIVTPEMAAAMLDFCNAYEKNDEALNEKFLKIKQLRGK